MREIKFRLWSKISQSMIEWDLVKEKPHTIFDWVNYIPMQYTGYRDKNNVMIFEGDLVKWKDYKNPKEIFYKYGSVMLKDYDVAYFLGSLGKQSDFGVIKEVEVIGNIHKQEAK